MDYIMEIIKNKEFYEWILINAIVFFVYSFFVTIIIRCNIKKKQENELDENRKDIFEYSVEKARERVNCPDYFLNRVVKIITSCSVVYGVVGFCECIVHFFEMKKVSFFISNSGLLLMVLIIIGIIVGNKVDSLIDKYLMSEDDECNCSIRLLSSIIVLFESICFMCFTKLEYNCSTIITVLGLVLGRFIYFDTNLKTIISEFVKFKNIWWEFIEVVLLRIIFFVTGFCFGIIADDNFLLLFFLNIAFVWALKIIFDVFKNYSFKDIRK